MKTPVSTIASNMLLSFFILYLLMLFFYPEFEREFFIVLIIVVSYSLILYMLKRNPYAKIIRACELNKNDLLPKHVDSRKTPYGVEETFSLVPGMCLSDFKSKTEPISQYLDKEIEFEYLNKNIVMKVYDK